MEKKQKKDLLSYIRNGLNLSWQQKIILLIQLSMPSIMAQITSVLMQYIDASMVGSLGANAAASIGLVSTTTWLLGGVCSATAAGFYIQVAQYVGAKKYEKARMVLKQSFVVVLSIALCLSGIGCLISGSLPSWLGGAPAIIESARQYFVVFVCAMPAYALNSLSGGMLRCSGNMKIPGLLNSLMCILDVLFNGLFIFEGTTVTFLDMSVRIPGMGLGVKGAALGTALAEVVVSLLMLYFLCVRSDLLSLAKHREEKGSWLPKKAVLQKALKLALPIGFEHVVVCSAYIMSTKIVAPLGIVAIAANSLSVTAESLCYMPGYGIAEAATTLVGQSVGAKRGTMTRSFARLTVFFGMAIMCISGLFMYLAAPYMIGFLTPDLAVRSLGTKVLRIEAFAEPLYGASIVVSGALRGAGDTLIPSIFNLVSMWIVRIPLSYVLSLSYGLVGVWIAMCVELCFRGSIFLIRLLREKWMSE